jgi:hypothetical protein
MSSPCELDHIFIMTPPGASVADRLVDEGFTEGDSRTHPGQGTTNRRFLFDNVMLEFLWVHDPSETKSDLVRPTYLYERWRRQTTDACPFGLCFRPETQGDDVPPFSTWEYNPPYLPSELDIRVADNAENLDEPFLFYLPWAHPSENPPEHAAGLRTVTDVIVRTPAGEPLSDAVRSVQRVVRFEPAETHHLTLVFDGKAQGKTLNLSPTGPVTVHY